MGRKQVRKQKKERLYRNPGGRVGYSHTVYTQDEASREGGRILGCVVVVTVVGLGGDRGLRGG